MPGTGSESVGKGRTQVGLAAVAQSPSPMDLAYLSSNPLVRKGRLLVLAACLDR